MLDDVEAVDGVEPGRDVALYVVDRGRDPAAIEPPAQVSGARIVEVGELDAVPAQQETQPVAADTAAIVEESRSRGHDALEVPVVREFRTRHGEDREVVQVCLARSEELVLVCGALLLPLDLAPEVPQLPSVVRVAEVVLELLQLTGRLVGSQVARRDLPVIPGVGAALRKRAQARVRLGDTVHQPGPHRRNSPPRQRVLGAHAEVRSEPVVLRRHHAFPDSDSVEAANEPLPVVLVQVQCEGLRLVAQAQTSLAETETAIQIFVVVDEIGVEAVRVQEELPLQRDVARIEARPVCVVTAFEPPVVELRRGPIEPPVEAIVVHLRMPGDVPEHACLE